MSLGDLGKLASWRSKTFKRQHKSNCTDYKPCLELSEDRPRLAGGTFGPPLVLPAGSAPNSAATGDFNKDGKADAVIADFTSANLTLALGSGDGSFSTPVTIQAGNGP